jgi:hypothetical protein
MLQKGKAMKCFAYWVSLALTLFALPGLALPGFAQQPPQDLVAFKATMVSPLAQDSIVTIPVNPPILSVHITGTGQSPLLGPITYIEHHITHVGVDGIPKFSTDGLGVITAANGDSLFLTYGGFVHTTETPGVFTGEDAFTVTGGTGKFLGATGSGSQTRLFDPVDKKQVTFTWEGMISRPKP